MTGGRLRAFHAVMRFKNILVATDLTTTSKGAVRDAAALAERLGATLHLLHVVTPVPRAVWSRYPRTPNPVADVDRFKAVARQRLAKLAMKCGGMARHIDVMTGSGDAADEIRDYARQHEMDLVVCGTHRRRGLERVITGSVAERVVRKAPCPVLVVGPGGQAGSRERLRESARGRMAKADAGAPPRT